MVELLMFEDMSPGKGSCTLISSQPPFRAGSKLPWLDWEEISQNSAEENLCGGEAGCRTRVVTVSEESTGKEIIVEAAVSVKVVSNKSFSRFHSDFGPFVTLRVVG